MKHYHASPLFPRHWYPTALIALVAWMPLAVWAQALPYAHTQPATQTSSSSTTLNGMVTPNGLPTSAWFEWGSRGDFNHSTPPGDVGAGTGVVRVSAAIDELPLRTQYQYRLVASNILGLVRGPTRYFHTAGKLAGWGSDGYGEINVPKTLSAAIAVAAGGGHALALQPDGRVLAWGLANYGETNVPAGLSNVTGIAAGGAHCLALLANGTVVAWGANYAGQTNVPANLSNVIAVAAGGTHNLALKEDGTVVAWGNNTYGQTNVPAGLTNVVAVSAGTFHSLALRDNGTVVAWGTNSTSELNVPAGLTNVVTILAAKQHSLAITADGKVRAWGTYWYNSVNWPLYVPASLSNVVAVASDDPHTLALLADGQVVAWGGSYYGETTVPSNLSNVVAIAAGSAFCLALGDNTPPDAYPDPVFGPANQDLVIALRAADLNGDDLVLRIASLPAAGTLYQYNAGSRGELISAPDTPVTDPQRRIVFSAPLNAFGQPYTAFSMVANDTLADSAPAWIQVNLGVPNAFTHRPGPIRPGTATLAGMALPNGVATTAWFEWGTNGLLNQATLPVDIGDGTCVVRVTAPIAGLTERQVYASRLVASNAAGMAYGPVRAFSTGSRVIAWGDNSYRQTTLPTGLTNAVAIGAGYMHSLALKPDGTLAIWGDNRFTQLNAPADLSNLIAVAGGATHSLALKADGTVAAWGFNSAGCTNVPTDLSNVVAIAAGMNHSLALRANGTVAAWGDNSGGQTNVPTGLSNVVAIAGGSFHSVALAADGRVVCWGNTNYPNPFAPDTLTRFTDLAAGGASSIGLTATGTVYVWQCYGPQSLPAGLTDIAAVGSGAGHLFAVKGDGSVVCWGDNSYNETIVPTSLTAVVGVVGGDSHSLALGNRKPQVSGALVSGLANTQILVSLYAADADGDPISVSIGSLPAAGSLYQCANGLRGSPITAPQTLVTDPLRRVIFVPATNSIGNPYAWFTYYAADPFSASGPATITVKVQLPTAPTLNASLCKLQADGAFRLNFSGQSNAVYRVWASTNLLQWQVLGTADVIGDGKFQFLDTDTRSWPRRFYRAGAP